jgi:hypothetical protein
MKNYIIAFLTLLIILLSSYISYTVYINMTKKEKVCEECEICKECETYKECKTCKKCDIVYNKKLYKNIDNDIEKFILSYKSQFIMIVNDTINKIKLPSTKAHYDRVVTNVRRYIAKEKNVEKKLSNMLKWLPSKSFKQCIIDIAPIVAKNDLYLNIGGKFLWNLNISKKHISSNDVDIIFSTIKYLLNQPIALPPKVILYFMIPQFKNKRRPDFKFLGQFICDLPAKYVKYIIKNLLTMDMIVDNIDSEDIVNVQKQLISDIDMLCSC